MLRDWDAKYCFWTLEKGPHTFVVYFFGHEGTIGPHYRCWLGVKERYEAKAVAFPITVSDGPRKLYNLFLADHAW